MYLTITLDVALHANNIRCFITGRMVNVQP